MCIIIPYMKIGSCVELVGVIGGCCESSCSAQGCYCDQFCYQFN